MVLMGDQHAHERRLPVLDIEARRSTGPVQHPMRHVQEVGSCPQATKQRRHLAILGTKVEAMAGPLLARGANGDRRLADPVCQLMEHAQRSVVGIPRQSRLLHLRLYLDRR